MNSHNAAILVVDDKEAETENIQWTMIMGLLEQLHGTILGAERERNTLQLNLDAIKIDAGRLEGM